MKTKKKTKIHNKPWLELILFQLVSKKTFLFLNEFKLVVGRYRR